jgi:peptide/nickel transport system ATP-binding protein
MPIKGTPPSLINVPSGCPFHPRCAYEALNDGASQRDRPEFRDIGDRHFIACHLSDEQRTKIWETDIRPNL